MDTTLTAADGTRLVGRRTGQGAPVVLVHGSGGGLDSWDPVAPLLADEFQLWVYARRGYPPSGACRQAKTFAHDVADLAAVLAAAGGSAQVVGGSYGATVALHAARNGVPGIRSLVLFEPPLFAAGPGLEPVLGEHRPLVAAGDTRAAARVFARDVARVPGALLDALDRAGGGERDAVRDAAEAVGSLHDLEAMAADGPDLRRWAQVDVPALLVQGADTWDPVPDTMDALAEVLPMVTRALLPGQSHFATHTAPALFADTLRPFLRVHR